MTLTHDRHLQTGIAGSVAIHALLLLLIVWGVSSQAGRNFAGEEKVAVEEIPEVTLIFPDQIIPEPPPLTPLPEFFIKTTQNEAVAAAPKNAKFQSDRNTVAASMLPPTTTSSALPMPTLDGNAAVKPQLNNSEHQDGNLTPKPQPKPASPLPELIAKAEAENTPADKNRLPLEVRKAEDSQPPAAKLQVRIPEDTPPLMTNPTDEDDFSAFDRMSKAEGSISREGENAVDAVATPRGLYESRIKSAIEQKWQALVKASTNVGTGHVHFRFYVDKRGVPQDLTILSDARDADPAMRELTLRAILDSQIPPIPADLLSTLEDGRLKAEYKVILY